MITISEIWFFNSRKKFIVLIRSNEKLILKLLELGVRWTPFLKTQKITVVQETDGCSRDNIVCLILPDGMDIKREKKELHGRYKPNHCPVMLSDWLLSRGARLAMEEEIAVVVD